MSDGRGRALQLAEAVGWKAAGLRLAEPGLAGPGLAGRRAAGRKTAICLVCCLAATVMVGGLRAASQVPVLSATDLAGAATKLPEYDVVTIRPNNQGPGSVHISTNINVFAGTNVSLLNLLQEAYDLQPDEISGGPKWVDSARFDVHGKIVDTPAEALKNLTRDDHRRMIRDLLVNRFHLASHTETRNLPVYELVAIRSGAKLVQIAPEHRSDAFNGVSAGGTSIHNGNLNAHYVSMASFAESMSAQVHRPVLDKTGMPGNYNFQLTWTREDTPAADDAFAPPLFTALEEQLGLKLLATKGPVRTLVIDRADLPSADGN